MLDSADKLRSQCDLRSWGLLTLVALSFLAGRAFGLYEIKGVQHRIRLVTRELEQVLLANAPRDRGVPIASDPAGSPPGAGYDRSDGAYPADRSAYASPRSTYPRDSSAYSPEGSAYEQVSTVLSPFPGDVVAEVRYDGDD